MARAHLWPRLLPLQGPRESGTGLRSGSTCPPSSGTHHSPQGKERVWLVSKAELFPSSFLANPTPRLTVPKRAPKGTSFSPGVGVGAVSRPAGPKQQTCGGHCHNAVPSLKAPGPLTHTIV